MANRAMQAKMLKLKRQRRAWAKPLSIKSGIRPNADVITGYKQRARGLALSDSELDQLVFTLFGTRHKGIAPARKAVLDTLTRIREEVPEFFYRTILSNNYQRVRAYHNSLEDLWVIVHEDFNKNFVRRSIHYSSLELAKMYWNRGRCVWEYIRELPVPKLDIEPLASE